MQTQKSGKKVVDLLATVQSGQRVNTTHSKKREQKRKSRKKLKQLGEGKSLCFAEKRKIKYFSEK